MSFFHSLLVTSGIPTIQASNIVIDQVTSTSFRITCTPGNGSGRLFVVRVGEAVNSEPENGTSYVADDTFGDGDELPVLGNYIVANGDVSQVTVNHGGLRMRYDVSVFESNGSVYNINTPATGNVIDARLHTNCVRLFEPDLIAQADGTEIVSYTGVKGETLTPGAAGRRPTFETNVINGHAVIDFASSDNLRGTNVNWDFLHQNSNTLIWVFKNDIDNATISFFDSGGTSSASSGASVQYRATGVLRATIQNASGVALCQATSADGIVPAGLFKMCMVRFTNGVGIEIEVSNVQVAIGAQTGSPSAATSSAVPTFCTGSVSQTGGLCPGDLAYLAGFNAAISDLAVNDLTGGLPFS